MTGTVQAASLTAALAGLRDALGSVELGLDLPAAGRARSSRAELVGQIDDYLLPRLLQMDAPLLMVVGGSTGAGKSTLVNCLVGARSARPACSARRRARRCSSPTPATSPGSRTTACCPGLPRTTGGAAAPGGLQLVADRLARRRASRCSTRPTSTRSSRPTASSPRQLLAAADSWLFVTTAARYADAVPWDLLQAARERGTALSLVLNRVPAGAEDEVAAHLRQMLDERGLAGHRAARRAGDDARRTTASRPPTLAPVRALARRAGRRRAGRATRSCAGRSTGALDCLPRARRRRSARRRPTSTPRRRAPRGRVARAYAARRAEIDEAMRSGSLLRGEVLARWHDVVGTGDLMRALETPDRPAARPRCARLVDRWRRPASRAAGRRRDERRRARPRRRRPRGRGGGARHGAQRPPGGRCSSGRRASTRASPELLDVTREEVRAGRASSSISSARRGWRSASTRGSPRSASTAPA